MSKNTIIDRSEAKAFLAAAREAQTAFWDALSELEAVLGVEVDGDSDLENTDIDTLLEEGDDTGIAIYSCAKCGAPTILGIRNDKDEDGKTWWYCSLDCRDRH
jgi:hypothetical protein